MTNERRHESPELGDAIVRMMRGLVTRAEEGDQEAIEQLRRVEQLAPIALDLGAYLAHEGRIAYSWTQIADFLQVSRQGARQRCMSALARVAKVRDAHQLVPGHTRRGCSTCHDTTARIGA